MNVSIREIEAAATIDLRHRVMWPNKPREQVILADDETAFHFGAFRSNTLVGVGSFFQTAMPCSSESLLLRKTCKDMALPASF